MKAVEVLRNAPMHLVQFFLPLANRAGEALPLELVEEVERELSERFGGVTAFVNAPARGLWRNDSNNFEEDRVVMVEVMVENFDGTWWSQYRRKLEMLFAQDEVLMRECQIRKL